MKKAVRMENRSKEKHPPVLVRLFLKSGSVMVFYVVWFSYEKGFGRKTIRWVDAPGYTELMSIDTDDISGYTVDRSPEKAWLGWTEEEIKRIEEQIEKHKGASD